jgi:hypothetical protein
VILKESVEKLKPHIIPFSVRFMVTNLHGGYLNEPLDSLIQIFMELGVPKLVLHANLDPL